MVEMFCLMQDRCKDELTMCVVSSFFLFVVVLIMGLCLGITVFLKCSKARRAICRLYILCWFI